MNIKKILESNFFEQISISLFLYSLFFFVLSIITISVQEKKSCFLTIESSIVNNLESEEFEILEIETFSKDITILNNKKDLGENNELNQNLQQDIKIEVEVKVDPDSELKTHQNFPNLVDINEAVDIKSNIIGQEKNISGVIDRLTIEIINNSQNKDLNVIWLFDASVSLSNQRKNIKNRFEKILNEIKFAENSTKKVNHVICSFGEKLNIISKEPSNNIEKLTEYLDLIKLDESGVENVFGSIDSLCSEYRKHRNMIIVFTDEVGDDINTLEKCISNARKIATVVYVVGPPAPFGNSKIQFKYVDPDPKFDQTEKWVEINQGPETLFKMTLDMETLPIDNMGLDSGFGPYALTRLCFNTGGIYFSVHPNRSKEIVLKNKIEPLSSNIGMFFDSEIMKKYPPDYRNFLAQQSDVQKDKTKLALIKACEIPIKVVFDQKTKFSANSEGEFSSELGEAQKFSARIEPKIEQIFTLLRNVESSAKNLKDKRWIASYNLAMGRISALKLRIELYNSMLAEAKSGLKKKDPKNNTWTLEPSDELLSKNSQLTKLHDSAKNYLGTIIENYPNTPWAIIAEKELETPMGYRWKESYSEPKQNVGLNGNNNLPSPRKDDEKRKIEFKPQRKIEKI